MEQVLEAALHKAATVRPPTTIMKAIQVRRNRHAGHCWRSRGELISEVLLWTPSHGRAKSGRPAGTYIQHVCVIRDLTLRALRTFRKGWTTEKGGGRRSGIPVLMARHDDDDSCDIISENKRKKHNTMSDFYWFRLSFFQTSISFIFLCSSVREPCQLLFARTWIAGFTCIFLTKGGLNFLCR